VKVRLIAVLIVMLLTPFADASAATTVSTPFVGASVDGVCLVTNVSRKPIVVSGRLADQVGGTLLLALDTCSSAPVEPGATCAIGAGTASMPAGALYQGFSCSIVSSSSKVRVVAYGSNAPGTAPTILPGTAK
jgi:hypothetical protein